MPTLKSKTLRFKKIAITTGDPNGVGFEVTAKALAQVKPNKNQIFLLFRDHKQEKTQSRYFKLLDRQWNRVTFFSVETALNFINSLDKKDRNQNNFLVDLSLQTNAAEWVTAAAELCLQKNLQGLVTGPLSKTLIRRSGRKELGHTGIFRAMCPKSTMHMAFLGKDFHVLLATDHVPFSKIESTLNKKSLVSVFKAANQLKLVLNSKKDVAVLGLNPHAGEAGLMGHFERKLLSKLPRGFSGPLVPDAAFLKKNWQKYSLYICLYHDQGLIPFKMHHGQDAGVHITLGLPFVRTSVDHGTAFDIYNKNLANPNSMLDAINLNLKLIHSGV